MPFAPARSESSSPSEQGKDAIFNLIVPGEIFGEIAFLDGGQRTADAVAIESGELLVIERRDFVPLLADHSEVAMQLIELLCAAPAPNERTS